MSFESAGYQLLPVLPELVLAVGAMALLMLGAYGKETTRLVTGLSIGLLVVVGVLELMLPAGKLTTFGGSFIVDDFARFLKILALIGSAATLILSAEFLADPSRRIFEYAILVLLSTLGMMVLISAGDLIMLYLGLELMSLALYVVAASNRDNAKSTEAGLKYFVLGALSSGMLLYGASLIYGFSGTFSFAGLSRTNPLLAFFFAMLLFSLAGVPPLAGFFGKFYVFVAAIKANLFTLAVIGVIASVVGAYYYLTIIKVMYFDEPLAKLDPMRMELRTVLAVAGLFNIFFFVYPGPLVSVATSAAKSLF